jgi:hypothetical protein
VKLKKTTEEISEIKRCKKRNKCERTKTPNRNKLGKNSNTMQHSWKIADLDNIKGRKEGR